MTQTGVRAQGERKKGLLRSPGVWLGMALSVVCLWLAFRRVPYAELSTVLSRADYGWLLPAVLFHLVAVLARAGRWQSLLAGRGILGSAFWAQGIGFLFTNVLPLRMGEPARVLAMSGMAGMPLLRVAGSAIVERMLDVATVLAMLVLTLPWMDVPQAILGAGRALTAVLLVTVLGLVLLVRYRAQGERILSALLRRLRLPVESALARWRELMQGVEPLAHPQRALAVAGWSVGVWGLYAGFYWCVLRAFQPDAAAVEATFLVVALALAITVPSSPGFIGVYQLAGQQALVLPFAAKYDVISALAVTLVSHVVYYLLTSSLGAIGLWQLGGSLSEFWGKLWRRARPD